MLQALNSRKIYVSISIIPSDGNNDAWQDRTLTLYDAITNEVIYTQTWLSQAWNGRQTHISNEFTIDQEIL